MAWNQQGGRDLPRLLESWTSHPLMCTPRYAQTAAAVLSGRLNIEAVRMDARDLGRAELESLATDARFEADAKKASSKRNSIIEVVGNIAVIQIYGALTRTWGIGPYSGCTGYDGILMQLEEAVADDEIAGIWLDIDSGGGTVNGLFALADTIYALRQANGGPKPIWAMASNYAYSAAFLLGTSADAFYVPPEGGVGSVGTITMHTSYREMDEKAGMIVTILRAPERKAYPTEYEDMDKEAFEHLMSQVQDLTDGFQQRVARNMNTTKEAVAATKGLDYIGSRAKAVGFVTDAIPEPIVWDNFQQLVMSR